MQFLIYATEQDIEASAPPSVEQLADLAKFTEESFKSGVLVATGGLSPSGTRLQFSGGKFTTTDAPLIEAKELTGGFAIIRADSEEEALEYAKRFRLIIGDGTSEIVRIFGPEDFDPQ